MSNDYLLFSGDGFTVSLAEQSSRFSLEIAWDEDSDGIPDLQAADPVVDLPLGRADAVVRVAAAILDAASSWGVGVYHDLTGEVRTRLREAEAMQSAVLQAKASALFDEHTAPVEPGDPWTRTVARTPAQMTALRKVRAAAACLEHDEFTCDHCERAPVCVLAFDAYNTKGDCLWEK